MERCKCCIFFDGMSFCHYHECECSYVFECNDYEEEEVDYYSYYIVPDCFSEGDLD